MSFWAWVICVMAMTIGGWAGYRSGRPGLLLPLLMAVPGLVLQLAWHCGLGLWAVLMAGLLAATVSHIAWRYLRRVDPAQRRLRWHLATGLSGLLVAVTLCIAVGMALAHIGRTADDQDDGAELWQQLGLLGLELTAHGHHVLDALPGIGCQARELTATIRLLTASADQQHYLVERLDLHQLAALDSVRGAVNDPQWLADVDALRTGRPLALLRLARAQRTAELMADPQVRAQVQGLRPTDLVAIMEQTAEAEDQQDKSWLGGVIDGVLAYRRSGGRCGF